MPEEATQVLAQFAAALTYDQLPDRIKDHCKNLLLDALACALAGHQGEETSRLRRWHRPSRNRAKAA